MKPRLKHNQVGVRRKPIGVVQHAILRSLHSHRWWYPQCGWVWSTPHDTKKRLDRLVALGLVQFGPTPISYPQLGRRKREETRDAYTLTIEGGRLAEMTYDQVCEQAKGVR